MPFVYPVAWPITPRTGQAFTPTQLDLNVASSSKSGGQSLSGIEQLQVSPAARWEGKFTMPSMLPEELLVWRGFVASLQGRLGTFLLPAFEYGRQPWPLDQFGRVLSPDVQPSSIDVTAAAAPINATTLMLTSSVDDPTTTPGAILAGHRFSIGTELHEVQQAIANADGTTSVDIRPWTRATVAAGTACVFDFPVVKVRFKTDDEGALRFSSHRTASPVLSVVEAP